MHEPNLPKHKQGASPKSADMPVKGNRSASPPPLQLQSNGKGKTQKGSSPKGKPVANLTTVALGGQTITPSAGKSDQEISRLYFGDGKLNRQLRKANPDAFNMYGLLKAGKKIQLPVVTRAVKGILEDKSLRDDSLKNLLPQISDQALETYVKGLSAKEKKAKAAHLQKLFMIRSSKMTFSEMAVEQKKHWEKGAKKKKAKSTGDHVASIMNQEGYGGKKAVWWSSLVYYEQLDWMSRFADARKELLNSKDKRIASVIKVAQAKGGDIYWKPEEVEVNSAFAYTSDDWSLHVGKLWLEAYEKDKESVYANLVHEMGGHNEYGKTQSSEIVDGAVGKLGAGDKSKIKGSSNSVSSTFTYPETEIWAELREHVADSAKNATDRPFGSGPQKGDVRVNLEKIKAMFGEKTGEALVRGMYFRAGLDDRVPAKARKLFKHDIEDVFKIKL